MLVTWKRNSSNKKHTNLKVRSLYVINRFNALWECPWKAGKPVQNSHISHIFAGKTGKMVKTPYFSHILALRIPIFPIFFCWSTSGHPGALVPESFGACTYIRNDLPTLKTGGFVYKCMHVNGGGIGYGMPVSAGDKGMCLETLWHCLLICISW